MLEAVEGGLGVELEGGGLGVEADEDEGRGVAAAPGGGMDSVRGGYAVEGEAGGLGEPVGPPWEWGEAGPRTGLLSGGGMLSSR